MSSMRSKIYFIVLTTLLVGGFPNFMVQEAFATSPVLQTANITGDNEITIVYDVAATAVFGDYTDLILVAGGARTVDSMTGSTTVTHVLTFSGAAAADDETATIDTAATIVDGAGFHVALNNQAVTDGQLPVFSSAATTSSTTIDVTFSESVTNDSALAGDFAIAGVATSPTVTAISGSPGTTLTLTLDAEIAEGESPTVAYTRNTRVIDDGTTGNILATFTAQTVTNNIASPDTGTGSGCSDCEAPTLGVNSESKRIVEGGFTYNGRSVDAERFFTPYPLITANVGKQNTAVFKIYEDKGPENIKHFAFAFGLEKSDIISNSKAMIELDIDHEGTETVTVTDPENTLDNIKVSTNIENCNGNDSDTQCLIVTINHRFRAPLDFNVVATDVWDMQRNSWQNYFNHGIEVVGESLNPAKEYDGINAGHIYHLTETSKNTALDEFGNSWSFQYGVWEQDYVKNERVQDTSSVFTRNHSDFVDYKELQVQNVIPQLLEICPTCLDSFTDFDDSFGHEYSNELNALNDPVIIQKMILENERAQKIMNYLLDPSLRYR